MQKPIDAVLIGAGNRGAQVYARFGLRFPERLRFAAVAEPDPVRRAGFAQAHAIPPENCFES
jgi:predicted dehydrogenase